ncbi:hypothetical protein [Enterococcus pallens]|uniref:Head decoration protein n=1 Tax=Enterococcus pallens ATCC BAA-351 TaxID=1158607 RepID=R2QEB8_9ENTE|nr:hypothetical protein [Enterococcus pallens]EOH94837.1 hypothetical protein UAU_01759 [Enterococcus pallens ATCC BAA-351]EOU14844.1 hypothetical protein I588_04494 [Enterococcus pallens ATCC BAA-351]OJG76220.1 hypothetical protein RV10_GL004127 [Enterococcus pallens]
MAKMGTVVTKGKNTKQILANATLYQAFGAQIKADGVTADSNGRKIIPAGTPVGGTASFLEDEMAELVVTNADGDAANTQGVLLYEIDVTAGTQNGTVLVFGFVNENRLDSALTVNAAAKTALENKVTFVKRNA